MIWHDMTTAPTDGSFIMGWHVMHKCPITIRFVNGRNTTDETDRWLEKTLTTMWPLGAFTHWTEVVEGP